METKEYRTLDKSTWGDGPWQDEPDKIQFEDEATKMPCLLVRGPGGHWCGYVGVTRGHFFYGKDYGQCPYRPACDHCYCEHCACSKLNVHGGITFAGACREGDEEREICHIPGPGEPDEVWWLGFDCAHLGDYSPKFDVETAALLGRPSSFSRDWGNVYRDAAYVKAECADLAQQLVAIKFGGI